MSQCLKSLTWDLNVMLNCHPMKSKTSPNRTVFFTLLCNYPEYLLWKYQPCPQCVYVFLWFLQSQHLGGGGVRPEFEWFFFHSAKQLTGFAKRFRRKNSDLKLNKWPKSGCYLSMVYFPTDVKWKHWVDEVGRIICKVHVSRLHAINTAGNWKRSTQIN